MFGNSLVTTLNSQLWAKWAYLIGGAMIQEFIPIARAFFMLRRLRSRKHAPQITNGAWCCIGTGHYGEAWVHRDYLNLVLKISGPAGWGCESVGSNIDEDTGHKRLDAWPVFARHCMQSPSEHLPVVYHVEQFSQSMTWGVLKRYEAWEPLSRTREEREWHENVRDMLEGCAAPSEFAWVWPLKQMADALRFNVDLHGGNILRDMDTGALIITDPFSSPATGYYTLRYDKSYITSQETNETST